MLNADIPVPTVLAHRAPTYGLIFHSLLVAASPATPIHSVDFDVQKGEYPPSLDDFDALIISGSASSAYDDEPWVRQLEAYIRDVYTYHPRVKIFGSCFGHQVVCQSLLGDYGVIVEKDGKGWEIGVKEIRLHKEFLQAFGKRADVSGCSEDRVKEKVRLQFVHHDHVVIPSPESLPISWVVVGRTEHCAVQGVYEAGSAALHYFDSFYSLLKRTERPSVLQLQNHRLHQSHQELPAAFPNSKKQQERP